MEGLGKRGVWLAVAITVGILTCLAAGRNPVLHYVGGEKKEGWKPNCNYTEWANQEHFYVGDWLYFGFKKEFYNVFQVNKTSYENCIDKDFIKNITKGGRDVFQLTDEKPYYFLSGGGYCYHGMRLAINVEEFTPTPAPSPSKNGSASPPYAASIWMALFFVFLFSMLLSSFFNPLI